MENCKVGDRVRNSGHKGTVVSVEGEGGGAIVFVQWDSYKSDLYAFALDDIDDPKYEGVDG